MRCIFSVYCCAENECLNYGDQYEVYIYHSSKLMPEGWIDIEIEEEYFSPLRLIPHSSCQ